MQFLSYTELAGFIRSFTDIFTDFFNSRTHPDSINGKMLTMQEKQHNHNGPKQRVQRRMVLVVNFFIFFK